MVLLLFWPAIRNRDSYPLSTYPMYAHNRGDVASLVVAVGFSSEGRPAPLTLSTISDGDDPLIAQSRLRDAVAGGRAQELCREIATRAPDGVTSIEIATERRNLVAHVRHQPNALLGRDVHAECATT